MQVHQASVESVSRAKGDIAAAANEENVQFLSSAGTFALRRSLYLAKNGELLLSTGQQRALERLIRANDPEARQTKIAQHLSLVSSIAGRYAEQGVDLFDLVKAGNRGLIHALENYVAQDELPFSTFASMCIRQHIELSIMNWNMRAEAVPATSASMDYDTVTPRNI